MRTNIDIEDKLMADAMKAGPYKTKKEAVEAGLKLLARQAAYREIMKWKATKASTGRCRHSAPACSSPMRAPRGSAVLVVDSSVWIGYFNAADDPAALMLDQLLDHGEVRLVVPDLVLFEVLRGFRHERDHRQARLLMETLSIEAVGGADMALAAAQHYRSLRAQGITVRSPIDVLVATFCIERDYALLHRDRDFDAFEDLRGLRGWSH
jgi:predicted nucleic acid-binding protein